MSKFNSIIAAYKNFQASKDETIAELWILLDEIIGKDSDLTRVDYKIINAIYVALDIID